MDAARIYLDVLASQVVAMVDPTANREWGEHPSSGRSGEEKNMGYLGRMTSVMAAVGLAIGAALLMAPAAGAAPVGGSGYGAGAAYQVELSSNVPGQGFWIWAELNSNGTGNYEETDCIHLGGGHATDAAAHAAGDVSGWSVSNGMLTISGVNIIGGLETADISVALPPSGYGSVSAMTVTVTSFVVPILPLGVPITLPAHGQVAP